MGHAQKTAPGESDTSLTLSAQLRTSSRSAHVAVEEAFDLDVRLADLGTYAHLLGVLRDFYGAAEDAIGVLAGWEYLTPSIDPRSRRRAALADRDLDDLGAGSDGRAPRSVFAGELGSLAAGLGCLYVLEGSTLGGRIVAHRARRALGRHVPVAFFSSAGRPHVGEDWSSLLAALDAFGAEHGVEDRRRAVEAACETFSLLGVALGAPEPTLTLGAPEPAR